ncbi:MAG: DUF1847 domain-containing protein [Candidatus Bathyarchaeota archaeon]|nr:MAG: DUF1847 domain-containing protein [Candidatus Bathyarchaeota archaeon]
MRDKPEVIDAAMERYESGDRDLYVNSTITEQRAYQMVRGRVMAVRPRMLEVIKFSEMMGWNRLGVAFCVGLAEEARRVVEILEGAGFDVCSVCCKCGSVDKTWWGISGEDKIATVRGSSEAFEAGCNPIVQAEVLNSESTELNVIVGLCIGHDIQFTECSEAPVTTLIVKDRVTGHNPLAALYSGYHHPRLWREEET